MRPSSRRIVFSLKIAHSSFQVNTWTLITRLLCLAVDTVAKHSSDSDGWVIVGDDVYESDLNILEARKRSCYL